MLEKRIFKPVCNVFYDICSKKKIDKMNWLKTAINKFVYNFDGTFSAKLTGQEIIWLFDKTNFDFKFHDIRLKRARYEKRHGICKPKLVTITFYKPTITKCLRIEKYQDEEFIERKEKWMEREPYFPCERKVDET